MKNRYLRLFSESSESMFQCSTVQYCGPSKDKTNLGRGRNTIRLNFVFCFQPPFRSDRLHSPTGNCHLAEVKIELSREHNLLSQSALQHFRGDNVIVPCHLDKSPSREERKQIETSLQFETKAIEICCLTGDLTPPNWSLVSKHDQFVRCQLYFDTASVIFEFSLQSQ